MAAGTLSVTNNSKAVVGVGTTLTALKAGDFLSLVVGQVPYTVAIASVESDTALTLVLPFDGPTATGLAWDSVARDTMSLATMGVTVQAQKALRMLIADEKNWRAIFGDAEEISVTLPNGQVMQGMSWGYLSQLLKQVDPVEMRDLQQQAAASEAAAQGYRNEAEGFKNDTNTIKNQTNQLKTDTQNIKNQTNQLKTDTQNIKNQTDQIKTQTNQIKTDTQNIKNQTNQIKTDTGVIRDQANTAKTDAQAARDAAKGYRNEAEQFKKEIDPSKLLAKASNLSDVADAAVARENLGLGATDNVTFNRLVTNALIQAGRATWDGNGWGTKEVLASRIVLMHDGVSPPGLYVKPRGTGGGYPSQFVYDFGASAWTTPTQITAQNVTATKTKMRYTEMWSGALFRGPIWTADNGEENYQSLVGGAVGTDGQGFHSGVAFGMMTSGGPSWPRAQISIGTQDRDAEGNMWQQMHFRFDDQGRISYNGPQSTGSFQQVPASDRNMKHDIADDASSTAYDNIKAMRFRTFVFNNDEQERQRRGVIAQEVEEIDPLYVKHREYSNHELNGPLMHQLELDTTPLLLDTMRALQDTIKQVEELKAEIAALKK